MLWYSEPESSGFSNQEGQVRTLGQLAAAAARELRNHLPDTRPATRAFADRINHMVGTMQSFNVARWRTIAKKFGEKFDNDVDLYFWARGIAGEVALLAVASQHQIAEQQLVKNVRKLTRVVRDVVRPRSGRKK